MAISLYDVSVANYLQTLGAVSQFLEKGLAHCQEKNIDTLEVVETRLFADMRPLRYQLHSVVDHSVGAVEALKSGLFRPGGTRPEHDYATLQGLVTRAAETLRALTPAEINDRAAAEIAVEAGGAKISFTAENFILSFSLPNFYLHAVSIFEILRSHEVPFVKREFIGVTRRKQ